MQVIELKNLMKSFQQAGELLLQASQGHFRRLIHTFTRTFDRYFQ